MYTVQVQKFEELITSALARRKKRLKWVTKLQYASQLRSFNKSIGTRHPLKISTSDLEEYVRALPSEWARRRAVSALGLLYTFLGREEVAVALASAGFSRPDRVSFSDVARALRRTGWTTAELRSLRWSDVRDLLTGLRRQKRPALLEPARSSLRRLLCKRYPSSATLLGDSVSALVFTPEDLDAKLTRRNRDS